MSLKLNNKRKSPTESATSFTVGTIKKGNDNELYVVTKTTSGVQRWTPTITTELNNMKLLTVDFLSKQINKPIKLYLREYSEQWPTKNDWKNKPTYTTIVFKPTGNALVGKKILSDWLKTKNLNDIKVKSNFMIEGYINYSHSNKEADFSLSSLQVDTKNKKIVSINLMNTEVFVIA